MASKSMVTQEKGPENQSRRLSHSSKITIGHVCGLPLQAQPRSQESDRPLGSVWSMTDTVPVEANESCR